MKKVDLKRIKILLWLIANVLRLPKGSQWSPEISHVYTLPRSDIIKTRKLSYRKDDRVMRPMCGCPKNFPESLTTPTVTFPEILMGFGSGSIAWMCVQNLKFVPEIIGVSKNSAVPGYAHAPFSPNFLMDSWWMDRVIVLTKSEVHSFTHSWDNSDWSFGWVVNPNLGEEEAVGLGDGLVRKSVGEFL